jgi:hypothetical protein
MPFVTSMPMGETRWVQREQAGLLRLGYERGTETPSFFRRNYARYTKGKFPDCPNKHCLGRVRCIDPSSGPYPYKYIACDSNISAWEGVDCVTVSARMKSEVVRHGEKVFELRLSCKCLNS